MNWSPGVAAQSQVPRLSKVLPTHKFGSWAIYFISFFFPCEILPWTLMVPEKCLREVSPKWYQGQTISTLPRWLSGKESACRWRRCERPGFHFWVRKVLGGGNGNPLQYSCLENPTDRGAWQATVHRVTESGTQLGDWAP